MNGALILGREYMSASHSLAIHNIVEKLLHDFLNLHGFELIDVEYVKEGNNWFLRVYIDKEQGIDIEDCSRVSEFLSEQLDAEDPIEQAYFLEVSSPGAERPLKKLEDFHKATNQYVFITTYEPIDGNKEFEGMLSLFDGESLEMICGKKTSVIPYGKVASARLAIQF